MAITGAIGLASSCIIADTVVNEMTRMAGDGLINVEHPSGSIDVSLSNTHGQPENIRASVIRTARKILSGMVYLPD